MNVAALPALLASFAPTMVLATGWETTGMTANNPAILYFEHGRPLFVMTCSGSQTKVQIRGFNAAQQWPQPTLTVRFGAIERSAKPDLAMVGDQTAFSFQFPISDSMLNAFSNEGAISVSYLGKTRSFPLAEAAYRTEFAARCAALVPPGMRGDETRPFPS